MRSAKRVDIFGLYKSQKCTIIRINQSSIRVY